jgi:hypothetical protein
MRFKAKKILTGEERVAERLVYTRCFDTIASDRGGNVVDVEAGFPPTAAGVPVTSLVTPRW